MTEEIRLTTEVLNCDYFNRNRGFNCYKGKNCTEVPDCYYRQLKRLEQERDELKFENDRYKQLLKGCPTEDEDCGFCVIDEQNKRLKQENEKLKKENERLKTLYRNEGITDICESCSITSAMEAYDYRSALEEIRNLCNKGAGVYTNAKVVGLINEVLNENN